MALVCSENSLVIERTIASSSTTSATCGNSSLTHAPLWPYWRNFHGDCITLPTLANCVGSSLPMALCGSWPWNFSSSGL